MKNVRDSFGLADSSEADFDRAMLEGVVVDTAVEANPFSFMDGDSGDFRPIQMSATLSDTEIGVKQNPKVLSVPELAATSISEIASIDDFSDNKEEFAPAGKVSIPPKVKEGGKQTS